MTDEQADRLGRVADTLDAALYALQLPVSPSLHVASLSGIIRESRDKIAAIVREVTGTDPWETNPLEG